MENIIATLNTSASGIEYLNLSKDSSLPGIKEELVIPMEHEIATKEYKMVSGQPLPENKNTKALVAAYSKKFTKNCWNS